MKRLYIDSNVLIAHYSTDKAEAEKKKLVKSALAAFAALRDIQLCTSIWAVTEMANILLSAKKMQRSKVAELENRLINEQRFGNMKITFLETSPSKDYDFKEFFYHVRTGILKYHSGVGDVIHSVIMKNNNINQIMTFDEKNDFKQIPGLTVVHPREIKLSS
jgi:predicted nucleic acid-binding protein